MAVDRRTCWRLCNTVWLGSGGGVRVPRSAQPVGAWASGSVRHTVNNPSVFRSLHPHSNLVATIAPLPLPALLRHQATEGRTWALQLRGFNTTPHAPPVCVCVCVVSRPLVIARGSGSSRSEGPWEPSSS
jgi:hypothetical protein